MDTEKILEKINNQEWKKHPVIENLECSEWGLIKYKGKYLKGGLTYRNGVPKYIIIQLYKIGSFMAHKLVYECFYGLIPDGIQIDHINTIRFDNRISNLRAVTPKENSNNPLTKYHLSEGKRKIFKAVYQINKDTNEIIRRYDNLHQAQRETGIRRRGIVNCCKKEKGFKTAGGFKWAFAES